MTEYVKKMVDEFPEPVQGVSYPWNSNLITVETKSPKLSKDKAEVFHTFVAKALFVCRRARQDVQPAVAFMTTRVRERMMVIGVSSRE
jgi:hypothetical protein